MDYAPSTASSPDASPSALHDPWNWCVVRVTGEVMTLLLERPYYFAHVPSLVMDDVFNKFQAHGVNGQVFLDMCADHRVLKDDLGIEFLGDRRAVVLLVERLRKDSHGYKLSLANKIVGN